MTRRPTPPLHRPAGAAGEGQHRSASSDMTALGVNMRRILARQPSSLPALVWESLRSIAVTTVGVLGTVGTFAAWFVRPSQKIDLPWFVAFSAVAILAIAVLFKALRKSLLDDLKVPSPSVGYAGPAIEGRWWMRDWRHEHEEKDKGKTLSHDATLTQNGSCVSGRFTNEDGEYELSGKIEDRIFMGTWRQLKPTDEHDPWYGAFQFKISPGHGEMKTMTGRWVGFAGDREGINCGEWEWTRPNKPFPSERGEHRHR